MPLPAMLQAYHELVESVLEAGVLRVESYIDSVVDDMFFRCCLHGLELLRGQANLVDKELLPILVALCRSFDRVAGNTIDYFY